MYSQTKSLIIVVKIIANDSCPNANAWTQVMVIVAEMYNPMCNYVVDAYYGHSPSKWGATQLFYG